MKHLIASNKKLAEKFGTKHIHITPEEIKKVYSRNVLSVDSDAKTSKGVAKGYLTGILYLSPSNLFTDVNLCPFASDACRSACLFSAGRGQFYSTTRARVIKTIAFLEDPTLFVAAIVRSIESLVRKAGKLGLIPAVRLNGTSDINWVAYRGFVLRAGDKRPNVFEYFPNVQFYDYTKRPRMSATNKYKNYHITFSDSGENREFIDIQPEQINIAVVFSGKALPSTYNGKTVINGDESDLRFLDPEGVIVGLIAKGKARKQESSFIHRAGLAVFQAPHTNQKAG
jgi:hypothetical protein